MTPSTLPGIRPELLTLTAEQFTASLPYALVFGGAVMAILLSVIQLFSPKWPVFLMTLFTTLFGAMVTWVLSPLASQGTASGVFLYNNMMVADGFSALMNLIFLGAAAVTALASFRYLDREGVQHPEYYVLLLFSAFGMMLMASALDLIVIFIALEILSLSVYALVGFRRSDRKCNEAAMKYFILGSAASAILLYGAALLYGATGTTNIQGILGFAQRNGMGAAGSSPSLIFALGAVLVIFGFLFKVASVPFHMWMPDVYEGAPTPITGFMTTGVKAAAFASFIRVLETLGYGKALIGTLGGSLHHLLWASAALTMVVGNIVALTQVNLKRMLAYSSIAHSGYLLIGCLAGGASDQAHSAIALYLVSYTIMNLGAFALLTALSSRQDGGLNLHDLSGLSKRHPMLALALSVFLLSMAGIPPTAGFVGKYWLLYSGIQAGETWLVVIAVLCSAVSAYYYLRVIVWMYMRDPVESASGVRPPFWITIAITATVLLTLQVGLLPGRLVAVAKRAIVSSGL